MLDGLKPRPYRFGHGRERRVNYERASFRVIEYVFDFLRRDAEVYRDDGRAHLRHPVIKLKESVAIQRKHGDAVALANAQPRERVREPVDSLARLAIIKPRRAADGRGLFKI
jgi:hypothetical protein